MIEPRADREAADRLPFDESDTRVSIRRFFANWIDFALLGLVNGFVVSRLWPGAEWWVYYLTWNVPALLYLGAWQGRTGRTAGKAMLDLRVVDASGRSPGLEAGLKRTLPLLLELFAVLALIAMLRSPLRQRLGDRWAGTYVVKGEALDPTWGAYRRSSTTSGISRSV